MSTALLIIAGLALTNAARLVWARMACQAQPVSRPIRLQKVPAVGKILVFV